MGSSSWGNNRDDAVLTSTTADVIGEDKLAAHYERAQQALKPLGRPTGHPTIGLTDVTGWYVTTYNPATPRAVGLPAPSETTTPTCPRPQDQTASTGLARTVTASA